MASSIPEPTTKLQIEPRYVKEEDGLRPFQKQTLKAIKDSSAKIVEVEAPVGSGKSHIIRELIDKPLCKEKAIVLTYPTKILMDVQVRAIRDAFGKSQPFAVWPDDREKFPVSNGINIFKYSSDTLIKYFSMNEGAYDAFANRGVLLGKGMFLLQYGKCQIFVTTPDVLWLIYSRKYRGAKNIQAQLKSGIVFFDEFHVYANLHNFYNLLENLIIKSKIDKVVLLSATPFVREKEWAKIEDKLAETQIAQVSVDFKGSQGTPDDKIFNYPLELKLLNFKYIDRNLSLKHLAEILDRIQTPAAIIFDSIFRLKHLKPELEQFKDRFKFREWSGMRKDKDVPELVRNQENVVALGTSAIEVGIDMKFRSLITEASNWASAVQRIGRVGRMPYLPNSNILANKGFVYLFVNSRDTFNRLKNEDILSRDLFENILQDTLPDPAQEMVGGELFRGESYSFILIDKYLDNPVVYSEAIFSMYEIDESQCRHFFGDDREKASILKDCGVRDKKLINELILRDKLFPIWGVIISDGLRNTYDRILKVEEGEKPKEVTVCTESNPSGFHFYKEKLTCSYLEQKPW